MFQKRKNYTILTMSTTLDQSAFGVTTPFTTKHPIGTSNESAKNDSVPGHPEYYQDAQIGFLVILFFFIVIGNVIVLAAIALSKERRRSRMNFFIMHLALCDLLTGPLIVLSDIVTKVTMYWVAGSAFCKIHKFIQIVIMYASTYMLVALSIDRLDAVARPLHFTGSWFRVKILVAIAWILSCLFAIPELILFDVVTTPGGPQCNINLTTPTEWQIYLSLVAASVFFIPALIILVCYLAIIVVIFNSSNSLMEKFTIKNKSKEGELLRDNNCNRERSVSCQSSRGIIPQAKIRTIKMTFIIVLVFILCWSPYFVFNLCHVYGALPHTKTIAKVSTFIQSLAPLNSAANPIIYGVFSTRVCRYIRRAPVISKVPSSVRKCCLQNSPTAKGSAADYTSVSETEDFRLTGDLRHSCSQNGTTRVPLVKQQLSEADKELLSLHVRGNFANDSV